MKVYSALHHLRKTALFVTLVTWGWLVSALAPAHADVNLGVFAGYEFSGVRAVDQQSFQSALASEKNLLLKPSVILVTGDLFKWELVAQLQYLKQNYHQPEGRTLIHESPHLFKPRVEAGGGRGHIRVRAFYEFGKEILVSTDHTQRLFLDQASTKNPGVAFLYDFSPRDAVALGVRAEVALLGQSTTVRENQILKGKRYGVEADLRLGRRSGVNLILGYTRSKAHLTQGRQSADAIHFGLRFRWPLKWTGLVETLEDDFSVR